MFNFFKPNDYSCVGPSCVGMCLEQCPVGMYDASLGICKQCDAACRSCEFEPTSCRSCKLDSSLPFLFEEKCIEECPQGWGFNAGVCHKCESPCATCGSGPSVCTSCDGSFGLTLNLGPTCVDKCPEGFTTNLEAGKCEGCKSGCNECDPDNQLICKRCESKFKLHDGDCVADCPKGFMSNFEATLCLSMASKDIKIIPFPWLFMALVAFGLSLVGDRVKPKHLLIPNWLVMMGAIENLSFLTQIVMTFRFGTWRFIIPIILAYALYIAGNPTFAYLFQKRIGDQDVLFKGWNSSKEGKANERRLQVTGSVLSWKFYKLLYSHFWGYNIKDAKWKEPEKFQDLQKWFLVYNCASTYFIVLALNIYGLFDFDWNTQLYISFIENIVIVLLMAAFGWWE